MSVMAETQQLLDLFEQVEEIEAVAGTLPESDQRRSKLIGVVEKALAKAPPVRPVVAGELLDLTEKTVRAWAQEGVLTVSRTEPRMLLDAGRLHQVLHLVADLRRSGKNRGLLDEVYRRLADQALLDREDLAASLEQMSQDKAKLLRHNRFSPAGDR